MPKIPVKRDTVQGRGDADGTKEEGVGLGVEEAEALAPVEGEEEGVGVLESEGHVKVRMRKLLKSEMYVVPPTLSRPGKELLN